MDVVYRKHTSYFSAAFRDLDDIAAKLRITCSHLKFDTLIGTGLSGTLVVPHLGRTLGTYWAIVRKGEPNHDYGKIVGEIGQNWLFVDDFVSMGTTLRRVQNLVRDLKVTVPDDSDEFAHRYKEVLFVTNYVGTYQYERDSLY